MSATVNELATLRDWLRWAVSRFGEARLTFGHGTTNAYDEAVYLLLHALHLPLDRLEPFLDARLTHAERQAIAHLLSRRIDDVEHLFAAIEDHRLYGAIRADHVGAHTGRLDLHLYRHRGSTGHDSLSNENAVRRLHDCRGGEH